VGAKPPACEEKTPGVDAAAQGGEGVAMSGRVAAPR
jgi:hypothetical protein